jgi:curved DNA-binding protein CbpA
VNRPSLQEPSYYQRLGVAPWASVKEIRQAYRDLSKRYHPDTSTLAPEVAKRRFQSIHEAYLVLTNPSRRAQYDGHAGLGTVPIVQVSSSYNGDTSRTPWADEATYTVTRRPLSPSELFALFAFGVTLAICLLLVLALQIWEAIA